MAHFDAAGGKPDEVNKDVVEFEIGKTGLRPRSQFLKTAAIIGAGAVGEQPLGHGQTEV